MPKFGWKCFIGSFVMSLGAVFVATETAFVLSEKEAKNTSALPNIQTKNIELFAQDDSETARYEKFNKISKVLGPENNSTADIQNLSTEEETVIADNSALPPADSDDVLYAPEDESAEISVVKPRKIIKFTPDKNNVKLAKIQKVEENLRLNPEVGEPTDLTKTADVSTNNNDEIIFADAGTITDNLSENAEKDIANDDISDVAIDLAKETDSEKEEIAIADASEFKPFTIPLVHNFKTSDENVTISNQAQGSQIALASQNVSLNNLDAESKAKVTLEKSTPLVNKPTKRLNVLRKMENSKESPWEVAETSNQHLSKNKIEQFNKDNGEEVSALNKEKQAPASAEKETKVAYKMTKNLLIPIPKDIMDNENLTPQLSYSEENKKLNAKLQKEHILPKAPEEQTISAVPVSELISTENNEQQKSLPDNENTVDTQPKIIPESKGQSSKSLTESIADWFSSSKPEVSTNKNNEENDNTENSDSAFKKLLNLGSSIKSGKNIVPSELKLAFQPNRAEISGQTLEWLHAFSENVIKNENVLIEIRIDGSNSFELQQKRLNLLYSILANNGVEPNKINIIFTEREPNSFIIRNVRYATEEEMAEARKSNNSNPWY